MTPDPRLGAALARLASRDPALAPASMRAIAPVLAQWIAAQAQPSRAVILGINGAQGSGKSTLAALIRALLGEGLGLRVVVLSIDDFYRTRLERQALAQRVHPLLATRGVPGTHDVAMARQALDRLRTLRRGEHVVLPHFIKAHDDRAAGGEGTRCEGPVDVVLFEGWCVGTTAQDPAALATPVNALEAVEDADGRWRSYVNQRLRDDYADLFSRLDRLVFLQAPSFDIVHAWRLEQEAGNATQAEGGTRVMSSQALLRFIAHYERLTRHALDTLPSRADVVLELDERRQVMASRFGPPSPDAR